ncbi:hypothetical protein GSI_10052 [Ganoderma sinense ZZ0214-1]|uniref:Uncharacterized protein n=1 Tax=Ganoderma sinense ZZ0214-1 TaxID=1077348 RepID=A0A2G8RZK3_9APHY|nr:hypothetical protein GSI_10052 [Ganoderma sinense ZZ0214-1]
MPNYPGRSCSVCHKHGCIQDHQQWCYMDDGVLTQTVLEGLGEVFRRSGHPQVPYPPLLQIVRNMYMMDAERQYVWPSASASASFPPLSSCLPCSSTFEFPSEALDLFAGNNADGLAGCIQDAFVGPPPHPTDGQRADNGRFIGPDHARFLEMPSSNPRAPAAANAPYMQCEPSPSYTAFATWAQGYVAEPHVPGPNKDMSYASQSRPPPPLEPSLPSPIPSPVPSVSPIERLEQGTYQHKQLFEGTPAGPIHFNAGLGVRYGALDTLIDGAEPAFIPSASIGMKASIRFEVCFQREARRLRV